MQENRLDLILNLEDKLRCFFRQFRTELNKILGDTLTNTEYSVLNHLIQKNPQIVTELSQEFHVSVSHITHVADQLEEKQLACRKRSQIDKRVVEIHITDKGRQLVEHVRTKKSEYVSQKFAGLTTEELKQLLQLLEKLS
jgi:DNA-binding MarR family transcriptional regulator